LNIVIIGSSTKGNESQSKNRLSRLTIIGLQTMNYISQKPEGGRPSREKGNDVRKYPNSNLTKSKDASMIAYLLREMLEQLPKYSM
jgi:hypothetical protein